MTIDKIQDEIIEEFSDIEDWMDRYSYIIEMGNNLEPFPEEEKTPANLIEGCQSRVWITANRDEEGNLLFQADSDAPNSEGYNITLDKSPVRTPT